jgi:membrane fusion protein, multidrug efflux system
MNQTSTSGFSRAGLVLWLCVAALAAGVVVLAGSIGRQAKAKEAALPAKEEKAADVRAMTLAPREFVDRVTIPGRVEPLSFATVSAEKAGKIVELLADKGDAVRAGQPLMRVEARTWEAYRRQSEVELREAGKERARFESLQRSGGISTSDFDRVQQRVDTARAAAQLAEANVSQCEVKSPLDGIVDNRFVERGEYAHEGAPVFRIVSTNALKVTVDLAERDIGAAAVGRPLDFRVAAYPDAVFTARVTYVAIEGSPESNTFRVELRADSAGGRLRPGMLADVSLARRTVREALVVPLAAVLPRKGQDVVFVVVNGRAERRTVRLEAIAGADVVLAGGVEAGDRVVVEGQRDLEDGVPVRVAN